uniref:Peptidase S54 rhomboid domain-containing protein n=1 Tax=Prymnesium polylepis TaxID=72548 RepID=A0A7S4IT64_9EUKA
MQEQMDEVEELEVALAISRSLFESSECPAQSGPEESHRVATMESAELTAPHFSSQPSFWHWRSVASDDAGNDSSPGLSSAPISWIAWCPCICLACLLCPCSCVYVSVVPACRPRSIVAMMCVAACLLHSVVGIWLLYTDPLSQQGSWCSDSVWLDDLNGSAAASGEVFFAATLDAARVSWYGPAMESTLRGRQSVPSLQLSRRSYCLMLRASAPFLLDTHTSRAYVTYGQRDSADAPPADAPPAGSERNVVELYEHSMSVYNLMASPPQRVTAKVYSGVHVNATQTTCVDANVTGWQNGGGHSLSCAKLSSWCRRAAAFPSVAHACPRTCEQCSPQPLPSPPLPLPSPPLLPPPSPLQPPLPPLKPSQPPPPPAPTWPNGVPSTSTTCCPSVRVSALIPTSEAGGCLGVFSQTGSFVHRRPIYEQHRADSTWRLYFEARSGFWRCDGASAQRSDILSWQSDQHPDNSCPSSASVQSRGREEEPGGRWVSYHGITISCLGSPVLLSPVVGLSCQVQIRLDIDPLGLPIDEIRFTGIAHRVAHDRSCPASDAWRFVSNVLLPIDPAYHHLVGGSRLVWTLREASGCLRLLSANFVHTGLVHLWLNCVALLRATSLMRSMNIPEGDLLKILLAAAIATTVFGAAQGSCQGASGIVFGYHGAIIVSARFSWVVLVEPILSFAVTTVLFAYGVPIISYSGHLGGLLAGGVVQVSIERTRGTQGTCYDFGKPSIALCVYVVMLALAMVPWLGSAPTPVWLVAPSFVGGGYIVAGVLLSTRDPHAVDFFAVRSALDFRKQFRQWAGRLRDPRLASANSCEVELSTVLGDPVCVQPVREDPLSIATCKSGAAA